MCRTVEARLALSLFSLSLCSAAFRLTLSILLILFFVFLVVFFVLQGPRKGEDDRHKLKVALEDLYNGKTCRLAVTRNRVSRRFRCAGRALACGACSTVISFGGVREGTSVSTL